MYLINPIVTYASVIWSCCDKEYLNRVLKLQKRAAMVILFPDRDLRSVQLFNEFKWILFYNENKISFCSLIFKLIQGTLPNCLIKHFTVNNQVHSRSTRCAKFSLVSSRYIHETDDGKSFLVRTCKLWNKLSLEFRSRDSLLAFKKSLFSVTFKEQLSLNYFSIYLDINVI